MLPNATLVDAVASSDDAIRRPASTRFNSCPIQSTSKASERSENTPNLLVCSMRVAWPSLPARVGGRLIEGPSAAPDVSTGAFLPGFSADISPSIHTSKTPQIGFARCGAAWVCVSNVEWCASARNIGVNALTPETSGEALRPACILTT
jgi:hypothetical protein